MSQLAVECEAQMAEWKVERIGDVCKTGAGGTPLKSKKEFYDGGDVPWLLSGEVSQGEIFESKKFITKEGLENSSAKIFPVNTVLVAMYGATAGQVGILRFEAATNQAVCGIYPCVDALPEYLFYAMLSKQAELIKTATGNAQPNISQIKIKNTEIPFPSMPEQKRIVAILDEAFAGISQAVANAEKNLANARELFESYLNNIFTQKGEGWVEKKLSDFTKLVSTGPFGSLLHKSDYVTKGDPLVNPINIVDGVIVPNVSKLIDKSTKERLGAYVLSDGDIVIARRGEIGRCAVVGKEQDGWICGTGCFFVKPLLDVNSDFLAHLLRSNKYREKLESVATGATMKNISNKSLSNLIVRIPSLEAQVGILKQISGLKQQSLKLEIIYQQKIAALTELKQSVLQKAFAGELTSTQDKQLMEAI